MKLYTWKDFNTYPYAGGMVTVIANDVASARQAAEVLIKEEIYGGAGYDLSVEPEVKDLVAGEGFVYYWEE
jgi:ethanolamine utilization microcompartment shell protein EutL